LIDILVVWFLQFILKVSFSPCQNNFIIMQRNANRRARSGKGNRKLRHAPSADRIATGIAPRGNSDPPRVLTSPWNKVVVVSEIVGADPQKAKCYSVTDLLNSWAVQLGVTVTRVDFRIESVQLWHLVPNGELNNSVSARFFSTRGPSGICGTNFTLSQQSDMGTPARNATVKYIWPLAESAFPVPSITAQPIFWVDLLPSQHILAHVHVLWRAQGKGFVSHRSDDSYEVLTTLHGHNCFPPLEDLTTSFENLELDIG